MILKLMVFLIAIGHVLWATPLEERHPQGGIRWQDNIVEANSTANLIQILGSLRISSHRVLGDMLRQDPSLITQILARVTHKDRQLQIPISGEKSVLNIVLSRYFVEELAPLCEAVKASTVNRIVLDVRGVTFYPCLMPIIQSESGQRLSLPSPAYSTWTTGVVRYTSSMPTPTQGQLLITVKRVTGPFQGTLVISNQDMRTLAQLDTRYHLVTLGKIVVVCPL